MPPLHASLPSPDSSGPQGLGGLPLDAFPLSLTVTDAQGRILQANGAADDLLGLDSAGPEGRRFPAPGWKLLHGDGSPMAPEEHPALRALREQRRIETVELGAQGPGGETLWLSVTAMPLGDDRALLTYGDAWELHRVREALRECEERFHTAFQFMPVSMGITTLGDGRFLAINKAFEAISGYSAQDLVGRSALDVGVWANAEDRDEAVRRMRDGQPLKGFEVQIRRKDGSLGWVSYSGQAVILHGEACLLSGAVDITDRRRAEEALRDSEEQLRIIFEASEAGIILVSPQGEIRFANRRMGELLGLSTGALMGTPYPDHLHPSEKEAGDELMRRLIEGKVQSVSVERRYLRGDGTDFWGHLSGRRLEHPDGSLRALVGVITDISDRKRMEEERRVLDLQRQQSRKMESLGSLAGGVAHDINNVLGAILGLASAHIEDQPEGSPTHQAFETIIKAAQRGGVTVKSLLSLARQGPSERRELDLNGLLREQVRLLELTSLAKVRLKLDLAPDLRPIQGEASVLSHALMNLCVNAAEAMPEDGLLTLGTRNLGGTEVEVRVADGGCGMSREVLDKALDPFFTTKPQGKGTGLGLSLVYSAMKAHEGQMEIHSEPGLGTTVILRFPACAGGPGASEPALPAPPRSPQRALNVLLVDDDELVQSSTQMVLQALGHAVIPALNGESALAAMEGGVHPDLVILDMNMPGLGGAGTLPRLRALSPTVPILLATGRADQAALNLVEAHPRVTLLSKPFSLGDLRKLLEAHGEA